MRKLLTIICFTTVLAAAGSVRFTTTADRATRAFDNREWANAAALYELLLDERPDSAVLYGRAIVANDMISDTAACVELMERAMSHGVPFDTVLADVRRASFSIGRGSAYGAYLESLRTRFPWMQRAVDKALLSYYSYRNDGPLMEVYAKLMLAGLPNSSEYRITLARAYLLTGRNELAVQTLETLLSDDPDNLDALLWLGNYYHQAGDDAAAEPYLAAAYRLKPTPYLANCLHLSRK